MRRKVIAPFRKFHHCRNFSASMDRARSIIDFAKQKSKNEDAVFLDIGCNKGFLMSAAIENHGWVPYGIEVVEKLTLPFKKKYRRFSNHVLSSKLHESGNVFKKNMFDVITAIDVIEHFEDPGRDMGIIFHLLKEKGIFVIQTPDTSCDQATSKGGKWSALKPLEHLFLFNRKNLTVFSQMIGYKKASYYKCFEEADGNLVAIFEK